MTDKAPTTSVDAARQDLDQAIERLVSVRVAAALQASQEPTPTPAPNPAPVVVVPVPPIQVVDADAELVFTCHMGTGMKQFEKIERDDPRFPEWIPEDDTQTQHERYEQATKWHAWTKGCNTNLTEMPIKDGHLETTISDGPTVEPGSKAYTNNNYAALVLQPKMKRYPSIRGGKCVQVQWSETASGYTSRRWSQCNLFDASQIMTRPNTIMEFMGREHPIGVGGGQVLQWMIHGAAHDIDVVAPDAEGRRIQQTVITPPYLYHNPKYQHISRKTLNGRPEDRWAMHDFEVNVSAREYAFLENGLLIRQGVFDVDLQWDEVKVEFIQMLYHSNNERLEGLGDYAKFPWLAEQQPPYTDTRRRDKFDIRELKRFPM